MKPVSRTTLQRWSYLAAALVVALAAGQLLPGLRRQREDMGLGGYTEQAKVPPGIALLVTASGPTRAIAINMLWMRATRLQDKGKCFELNELYKLITLLEPRMPMVWAHAGWNLAYNVSVKFPADQPAERWRWVRLGIELLRDYGIPYNPRASYLYKELAWIFDHKVGQTSDDAHVYYKVQLTLEMQDALGQPPYLERLKAIAAAPRSRGDLLRDDAVRTLVERLRATGIRPFDEPLRVANRGPDLAPEAKALLADPANAPAFARLEAFLRADHLRRQLKMRPGGVRLTPGDILDWTSLCAKLATEGTADRPSPGRRIWELLPAPIREAIHNAAQAGQLDEPLKAPILDALNQALKQPDFYREDDFRRVALPKEQRGLLKLDRTKLTQDRVIEIHRILLHAAYRHEVAPAGLMLRLMERYGPIDWRLPDALALYWSAAGIEVLGADVDQAANTDRIAFHALVNLYTRGTLRFVPATDKQPAMWIGSPNFAFIEPVLQIYEETFTRYANTKQQDPVREGYLNFLRSVVLDLYVHNDIRGAQRYWKLLTQRGPESGRLIDFVLDRRMERIQNPTHDDYRNMMQGHLYQAIWRASLGQAGQAAGLERIAQKLWNRYQQRFAARLTDYMPSMRQLWLNAMTEAVRTFPKWQVDRLRELFPDDVKKAEERLKQEQERERRERERRGKAAAPPAPRPRPSR